ncbi:hypothetical protein D3C78_1105560 [compost metagenome]
MAKDPVSRRRTHQRIIASAALEGVFLRVKRGVHRAEDGIPITIASLDLVGQIDGLRWQDLGVAEGTESEVRGAARARYLHGAELGCRVDLETPVVQQAIDGD